VFGVGQMVTSNEWDVHSYMREPLLMAVADCM
jgi:hypothetical protein